MAHSKQSSHGYDVDVRLKVHVASQIFIESSISIDEFLMNVNFLCKTSVGHIYPRFVLVFIFFSFYGSANSKMKSRKQLAFFV